MQLKALLVDDEINIMRNLQTVIPWEELNIGVVGMATNGVKAMELVGELAPDLILSDIRMPVMDGIALLKWLQEQKYEGEVIMLTGFQEFDYARSAVKYGAKDFILKPIDYEELRQIVERLALQIREKRMERLKEEKTRKRLSSLAYEKMLHDVLLDYTSVSMLHLLSEDGELPDKPAYTLLVADLDGYSQIARPWSERERKLWNFAVRNVLQEALLPDEQAYAVLQTREGEWCLLLEHRPDRAIPGTEQIRTWSQSLQAAVEQCAKLTVSIGIFASPVPMERLAEAYKCVQRSLQLSPGKQHVVFVDGAGDGGETNEPLWSVLDELVAGLKTKDRAKIEQATQGLHAGVKAILAFSVLRGEQMLHFVVLHLMREMREIGLLEGEQEEAVWAKLEKSVCVKELLDTIDGLTGACMNAGLAKKTGEVLMVSAKDYIQRHMSGDLGIEEVADYLGISCSYFSLLFKQQFGETFVEYLTRQRMELAKSLLVMTGKSVTSIGNKVGYTERRYFTKVFHKYEGMTPTEFRERHAAGGADG